MIDTRDDAESVFQSTNKAKATKVSPKKKAASPNKKKAAHNKTVAPNKKKAAPNKKKASNKKKESMATPRSNALSYLRGAKVSAIPFLQQEGRNFYAFCRSHPHLDCPILPSTMSNTLEGILFIFCLHYPGDNHFDKMREKGLLWLTRNGYLGEICLRFLTSTINAQGKKGVFLRYSNYLV